MSEILKMFAVQNMKNFILDTVAKKVKFSKDFRTDGARISKIYNYFYKKIA